MRYKPYEFKEEDAENFARNMGIHHFKRGNELFFKYCPYCKSITSGNKKDEKTFSINLSTGLFKCFRASCGVQGNMITLSKDFNFSLGNEVDEYYRPQKRYRNLKTPSKNIVPKEPAIDFLNKRGISEEIAKKYEITVRSDNDKVLVFPFFNERGLLQFIKYRKIDFDKEKDNCKEWCEKDCKPILFGMKQCDIQKSKVLTITEGQMDSLAIAEAFNGNVNVVSVPTGAKGMTWIPYTWDWLCKFDEIIVFGDYENDQITLLEEINNRCKFATIKHVKTDNYKDCKDANEILLKYGKEQIKKCIEEAVRPPMVEVKELADVENINIYKLEKLKTGVNNVDRLLYGGLPFGGVHIISGKPGEGKSTLTSQIMINAIEQGYKCFAYSGELPNYLFKDWTIYQIAGRKVVDTYQNEWGDKIFDITDAIKKMISEWMRGKYYIYDNSFLDSTETESLVITIEKVVRQYGVRVILLDNLMTAIDLEPSNSKDVYEKQSQFVKKLARLAIKFNILILLVAHKRKNNHSSNENNEISGSGDISNLATITISYGKDKDLSDDQRNCKISKNRLFGKTNTQGWTLNYDEKSRRIYGDGDDADKVYGWNTSVNSSGQSDYTNNTKNAIKPKIQSDNIENSLDDFISALDLEDCPFN